MPHVTEDFWRSLRTGGGRILFTTASWVGRSVGIGRSQDGMYFSSVEGITSPSIGITFAGIPVKHRIAIVGDSFTFGLDVYYQETWGHQIEVALGPGTQVLNFGVDGYGVDQAYFRYQRDVILWRPEIVILGIINDDIRRTMGVYGFLTFPDGEVPFPKPRFIMRAKALVPLNLPLPTPETIFASKSITDLPFIRYDAAFHRHEWDVSRLFPIFYPLSLIEISSLADARSHHV